jgi:hypothetical protein
VREWAIRRSQWAAGAGCLLSVLVHGTGAALVLSLAQRTIIDAPLEIAAITLVTEEPRPGEGVASPVLPAGPVAEVLPARHARHHVLASVAAQVVLEPPPEPLGEESPVEPVEPPPAAPAPAAEPAAAPAPTVEPEVARALRVYDSFPTLPDRALRGRPDLDVQVCVSTQGSVSDAVVVRGPVDSATETVRTAILGWRYRPYTLHGAPAPFCHLMRISYRMN